MLQAHWLRSLFPHIARTGRRIPTRRARRRPGVTVVEALEARTLLAATNPVDLSTLDGTNGFTLNGIADGDLAGFSVSSAGDVNGDGYDDVLIGATRADAPGAVDAGVSYVVFGRSGGFPASLSLSDLDGSNGFALPGVAADDDTGVSVNTAGDVNGDGFDDLIIGASYATATDRGDSYVVFGRTSFPASLKLSDLNGTNGFVITGADPVDRAGYSVSGAGDVNGDGFEDLIIGAFYAEEPGHTDGAGAAYVVFGRSGGFSPSISLASLDGTNGFSLQPKNDEGGFGRAVSGAGDVNGDGFDDVLIGAWFAEQPGGDAEGESYVVFGGASAFPASINVADLDGSNGFAVVGIDIRDRSGRTLSSLGDINGDGFDDIIISAIFADNGAESYIVFGRESGYPALIEAASLDGDNGFVLRGVGGSFGRAVSGAGDVNGDGFDDLLVGAPEAGGGETGEVYLMFGHSGSYPAEMEVSSLDGTNGFLLIGAAPDDLNVGRSARIAGDVNGDGFDDIVIGAHYADHSGGTDQGKAYVVFGGNFTGGAETQVGDGSNNALVANQGAGAADILIGGRGYDTLYSDGGDDVLIGGKDHDRLVIPDADFSGTRRLDGGNGTDQLRLAGSGITLDLTAIPDIRIIDIERIDIRGSGANALVLDLREVLNLSTHSNTLVVEANADDSVTIGTGWTRRANETLFGQTFAVFTQGAAILKVQASANIVHPFADIAVQQSDGTWSVAVSDGSQFTTSDWADWGSPGVVWGDQVSGDFNGDGLEDVAARNQLTGQWTVGLSTGASFSTSVWGSWNPNKTWGQIQVADFNGDGRDDIAGRVQNAGDGRWFVSLSTGSSFQFSQWVTWNPNKEWGQVGTGDFNGDGKADLVGRVQNSGDGRWFVSLSTGTKFLFQNWLTWLTHVEWGSVQIGDYNGDGLSDIASRIQEANDGRWFLGLSTGSGFTTTVGQNFRPGQTLSHELVGDFDGDGDSEIAARLASDGHWFVLNLSGGKFGFEEWGASSLWSETVVGDFNGDGRSEIAGRHEPTKTWQVAVSDGTRFNFSLWGTADNEDWDYAAAGNFA